MRILQSFDFDQCSIRHASYAGSLHMAPHTDGESKISIVLDGSLLEKTISNCVEAKRNSVVIKPHDAVHENVFGHRGVSLLSITFRKHFSLPEDLHNWDWFEDPRVSFTTYKLWYSLKAVKTDRQLNEHLREFIQTMQVYKKSRQNVAPEWLQKVEALLKRYSLNGEHIDSISDKLGISRVHISRTFKKHQSISPARYRHYARMSELLYCLACTTRSLADISYECGFSDQSQMSRVVLKETGFTPNALRMLLQKR